MYKTQTCMRAGVSFRMEIALITFTQAGVLPGPCVGVVRELAKVSHCYRGSGAMSGDSMAVRGRDLYFSMGDEEMDNVDMKDGGPEMSCSWTPSLFLRSRWDIPHSALPPRPGGPVRLLFRFRRLPSPFGVLCCVAFPQNPGTDFTPELLRGEQLLYLCAQRFLTT